MGETKSSHYLVTIVENNEITNEFFNSLDTVKKYLRAEIRDDDQEELEKKINESEFTLGTNTPLPYEGCVTFNYIIKISKFYKSENTFEFYDSDEENEDDVE